MGGRKEPCSREQRGTEKRFYGSYNQRSLGWGPGVIEGLTASERIRPFAGEGAREKGASGLAEGVRSKHLEDIKVQEKDRCDNREGTA